MNLILTIMGFVTLVLNIDGWQRAGEHSPMIFVSLFGIVIGTGTCLFFGKHYWRENND